MQQRVMCTWLYCANGTWRALAVGASPHLAHAGIDALEHAKGLNHLVAAPFHCGNTCAATILIAESLTLLSSKNIDANKARTAGPKQRRFEPRFVTRARSRGSCSCTSPQRNVHGGYEEFLRARPSRIKGIIVGGFVAAFVVGALAAIAMRREMNKAAA